MESFWVYKSLLKQSQISFQLDLKLNLLQNIICSVSIFTVTPTTASSTSPKSSSLTVLLIIKSRFSKLNRIKTVALLFGSQSTLAKTDTCVTLVSSLTSLELHISTYATSKASIRLSAILVLTHVDLFSSFFSGIQLKLLHKLLGHHQNPPT